MQWIKGHYVNQFCTGLLFSKTSHGESDQANAEASTASSDSSEDDDDDSTVDDDEDENEDYVKEFENGKACWCFSFCWT